MQKTTVYFPDELLRRLRDEARRRDRSQADLIREAVDEWLVHAPRQIPRSIGSLADGSMPAEEAKRWARRGMADTGDHELDAARATPPPR